MALAKFGLKFKTKDPKINIVFEGIRTAINQLVDSVNKVSSKDELVKIGSEGTPDFLSASHFERTQTGHVVIKQNYLQHGMLSGLNDDDHTQYALLIGRSGGQTLIGGTASGEDLELQTTSDATKGDFIFRHGTIKLYDTDNSNYLGFIVPDISGDITYTLPLIDGSASDFLQTNGTGTLIWAAAPGATQYFFKTITGITNDVVADAIDDTLTLASANNRLTIVGTTATDTITWTLVEANIDHSAISNLSYASAGHTGFEPTVTKGNLTETTSNVLSITGGTGVIIGSGTTIQVTLAATGTDGYLSGTDWDTFNSKQAGDNTLTALAGLSTSADKYIRVTGTDAFDLRTYANVLADIGGAAASHAMSTHSDISTYSISTSGILASGAATITDGVTVKKAAGDCIFNIETYDTTPADYSQLHIKTSDSDTIDTISETQDGDTIGRISLKGVDNTPAWDWGARITAIQNGAAGVRVPTNLYLETYSATALNANQLILLSNGNISMAGKVGIGTSTPAVEMELNGNLLWNQTTQSYGTMEKNDVVILQFFGYDHDNMGLFFDAGYTPPNMSGGWASGDVGSNYGIYKRNDCLDFVYDSGVAIDDGISWNTGISIDISGGITIGTLSGNAGHYVKVDANGKLYTEAS